MHYTTRGNPGDFTMTTAKRTYDILDGGMRYVGAHRISPGQKTIDVTEDEAKFFVEGGGLALHVPPAAEGDAESPAEKKGKSTTAKAD